jgi:hypothetical protein
MNLLAHGSLEDLRADARQMADVRAWRKGRAFLAQELADLVDTGTASLADLQHDVLVPLELDVMACRTTDRWTPAQLVRGLLDVLPPRRSARPRGSERRR